MKRRWLLLAVWMLPAVILLAIATSIYFGYRITPPARLDPGERARMMMPLRTALGDHAAEPCDVHRPGDTVAVTVWLAGRTILRIDGHGSDLASSIDDAAKQILARPEIKTLAANGQAAATRIQVDVIIGRAPVGTNHWLFSKLSLPGLASLLALNPGIDGLGAVVEGRSTLLLPHELVMSKLLATKRPSDSMGDFALGTDLDKISALASQRIGMKINPSDLYRFRTDTFIEPPDGHRDQPPLALYRGSPPAPLISGATLREAALNGARYLVAHLAPSGRYIYEHDLTTGKKTDPTRGAYSMPRHGGTTYFLAQVYRITKAEWLREPIERAFAHLVDLMAKGNCAATLPDHTDIDCVIDKGEGDAGLGSTALVVVALAEYQRATGDMRYLPLMLKLANWLLFMQRPDGSFRHLYNPMTKQADDKTMLLYYSGEASLALARMYTITSDPKYAQAAERGLDWLVNWYDFFVAGFFFGEEHWTCIAAEAIWPAVKTEKYRTFCNNYGEFLRGQQPDLGEFPDEDDLVGSYLITPFVPPMNTPAGSRTEAMISAYTLGAHAGAPDEALRGQITATLQYALGQQIRPENDFNVVGDGNGGMPASLLDRSVRIDYVQHVCSGMIRASEWIDGQAH